jgi:hypothetical protein
LAVFLLAALMGVYQIGHSIEDPSFKSELASFHILCDAIIRRDVLGNSLESRDSAYYPGEEEDDKRYTFGAAACAGKKWRQLGTLLLPRANIK